jgi:hypothetical protein
VTAGEDASARRYPADVEALWIERARGDRSAEDAIDGLGRRAGALSDAFTTDRPVRFGDYAADDRSRLAYGLYFFPRTWCLVRFPLEEAFLFRGASPPADRPPRVLDLGAGLGAAGWSAGRFLLALGAKAPVRLHALDRSAKSLADLEALVAASRDADRVRVTTERGDFAALRGTGAVNEGPYDLVLCAFAWNEAFADVPDAKATETLTAAAALLSPRGVLLLVEPALRETSERLRRVAAPLVGPGRLATLGPCLSGDLGDPPPRAHGWDHDVRPWTPPESLLRVNRRLRRDVKTLRFSFLALTPAPPAPLPGSADLFRLTSPVARLKGRRGFTGWGSDGKRRSYEVLERVVDRDAHRRLVSLERGDVLAAAATTVVGGDDAHRRLADVAALSVRFRPS